MAAKKAEKTDSVFKIPMGAKVKDRISGFTGIVISRTQWYNGCIRYMVQPQKLAKDGKTMPSEGFDEEQLQVVVQGAVKPEQRPGPPPGGPRPSPSRPSDPSRR